MTCRYSDSEDEDNIEDTLKDLYEYELSQSDSEALYFLLKPYFCKRFQFEFKDSKKWYLKHFVSIILYNDIKLNVALNYLIEALYHIPRRDILYECNISFKDFENRQFGLYLEHKRILLYKFYDGSKPDEFITTLNIFFKKQGSTIPAVIDEFKQLENIAKSSKQLFAFINTMKGMTRQFASIVEEYRNSGKLEEVKNEALSEKDIEPEHNAVPEENLSIIPAVVLEEGSMINKPYFAEINGEFDDISFQGGNDLRNIVYPETETKESICMIFNNISYERRPRNKTEIDIENIENTFSKLHFHKWVFQDTTKETMFEQIKLFTNNKTLIESGAMIVCILMGHGDNDGFYDIKEKKVSYTDFYDLFRAKNCPAFQNKPKIFIIQACRGDKKQTYSVPESVKEKTPKEECQEVKDTESKENNIELGILGNDINNNVTGNCNNIPLKDVSYDGDHNKYASKMKRYVKSKHIPDEADFIKINATTMEHKAARCLKNGSPFIENLCKSIDENSQKKDLSDIFLIANSMICNQLSKQYCHCAELITTARSSVYLKKPTKIIK